MNESFSEYLKQSLKQAEAQSLKRQLRDVPGSDVLNFSDNDYLGLSQDASLKQAFSKAVMQYGVGAGASRLLSGTSAVHLALENYIAEQKQCEKALVFGSGYAANLGIISALTGEDDFIFMDKLNHASIIDAVRLSQTPFRVFPHKNYSRLEELLNKTNVKGRKWIITDSVFSMDGDLADLPALVEIKQKKNAVLMIDEAHGTGVFGDCGNGVAEHFNLQHEIDIQMGTLSKAVGVFGGYVAAKKEVIDSLIHFSRPFIFATAPPAALMQVCLESLKRIHADRDLRDRLWKKTHYMQQSLKDLGFNIGETASPIIPILIGEEKKALQMSEQLWQKGVYIPAIRYPTVRKGEARLRLTVSARHSDSNLQQLVAYFAEIKGQMSL